MPDIEALIDALGGRAVVGFAADVHANTVTYWVRRGRIPVEHWPALIKLAESRKVNGVDSDLMLRLHRPRKVRNEPYEVA